MGGSDRQAACRASRQFGPRLSLLIPMAREACPDPLSPEPDRWCSALSRHKLKHEECHFPAMLRGPSLPASGTAGAVYKRSKRGSSNAACRGSPLAQSRSKTHPAMDGKVLDLFAVEGRRVWPSHRLLHGYATSGRNRPLAQTISCDGPRANKPSARIWSSNTTRAKIKTQT